MIKVVSLFPFSNKVVRLSSELLSYDILAARRYIPAFR